MLEKMQYGSLDGKDDGEHNGVGFVEMHPLLLGQDTPVVDTETFDSV